MSDVTLAEISKGVWVPRGLPRRPAGTLNPEDEEDECECLRASCPHRRRRVVGRADAAGLWAPLHATAEPVGLPRRAAGAGLARQNADAGEREDEAEEERRPRPLEPVAAVTYEQARKMGDAARAKAAKEDAAMEKVFSNYPDAREPYSVADWHYVPDTERPEPFLAAWYSCVKRYRFIQYGSGPLAGGPKLIIEVVLMGDTLLRYILKLSQVKEVLTKSNVRDTHGYERIEEVIIDQRQPSYGYAPEQLKLKFSGAASALAFQMDLMSVL